jgi:hypothetical protein
MVIPEESVARNRPMPMEPANPKHPPGHNGDVVIPDSYLSLPLGPIQLAVAVD